jgi:NitT/TauT family transport system ATP-binding protein
LALTGAEFEDVVLRTRGLSKTFDGRSVLVDVDFEVHRGELVCLVGPSGSGKSTLLRLLAGLIRPSSGTVEVEDGARPAMVFQDAALLPWRTVEANVRLPRELTGGDTDILPVLDLVGMRSFARLYPHQLSGGMRQRAALARALAQDAGIILMDEPFASLDALVRERFDAELKRLHAKTGAAIVFVTHSIDEAIYLGDRIVVLTDSPGRIAAVIGADPDERRSREPGPAESRIRTLLGRATSTHLEEAPKPPPRPSLELIGVGVIGALLIALWSGLIAWTGYPPLILPGPARVAADLLAWAGRPDGLFQQAWVTISTALLGLAIGGSLAGLVGYPLARLRWLERLVSPFIVAFQAMPIVGLAPLLVLWFGYGLAPRLLVTALISFFPVLVATIVGIRQVDEHLRDALKTMGANGWQTFVRLEVPGALPVLFGGLRLAATLALVGAVVGEFVTGGTGLGSVVLESRGTFNTARAFSALFALAVIGSSLYVLVATIEHQLLAWRRRSK